MALPSEKSFEYLGADSGTRQALDLFSSGTSGSLLHVFTSSGFRFQTGTLRLLRTRLASPLHPIEHDEIVSRLNGVKLFLDDSELLRQTKTLLTRSNLYGDAERALQRIALAVHRTPLHLARDLRSVALSMQLAESLSSSLSHGRWEALQLAIGPLKKIGEKVLQIVGIDDEDNVHGVMAGADEILDQLLDSQVPKQLLLAFERDIGESLGVPVKVGRGRGGPDDIYFSVSDKHSEHVAQLAREQEVKSLAYVGMSCLLVASFYSHLSHI